RPWLDAVCAASAPQLRAFGPQALANTACALAQMDHAPPPHWVAAFLHACLEAWAPRPPPPAAQGAAAGSPTAASHARPPAAAPPPPPQALALTLWAVARLGLRPGGAWLDAMAAAAAADAPRMNGQDVANVLWALGALRYRPGQAPHPALSRTGVAGAPRAAASAAGQRPGLEGGVSCSDGDAAAAAPGLVLVPLLAAWRRCAEGMEPQQLSACLVAAAHMQLGAAGAGGAAEQAWLWALAALGRRLGTASGQCVANALWAAARLGCRPSNVWMVAAVARFAECLEEDDGGPQVGGAWAGPECPFPGRGREAANVWWALGRLRWAPAPEVGQQLLVRTLLLVASGDLRSGEVAMF
ncbi:hypothetical protein TSOC_015073, partial [Tetrabaena socialis]